MNNKYFYPAIFHKTDSDGFWISFPDIPECLTEGENMSHAYEMAIDALGLCLEGRIANNDVPIPSKADEIKVDSDAYLVIVEFDMLEYKKRTSAQAVKKTLSIPSWLNEAATASGINFSNVLQEALKERLGIKI